MEGSLTSADDTVTAGPDLARCKRMFDEARDLTSDARKEQAVDIDYYDSKQWTATERRVLKSRKQPDIVINRIKPAVNGTLGVVQRGRSEPRAWPRTPQDDGSADVATDTLRYIGEFNRFDALKLDVFKDMLVPGSGAAIVEVDDDRQVTVTQIRWEEFFYDPRSRRNDFKDARYLGVAKWMYVDDLVAAYPDKKRDMEAAVQAGSIGGIDETFSDRPSAAGWSDRKSRRLMVVEMYYRSPEGWLRCVFHGGGFLEKGASPYLDRRGQPDCPIEAHSLFVDRDNNRYGAVRDMRGPQDEINKRRSKLLHQLSTRQLKQTQAGDDNADAARKEAARPDGVIPYNYDPIPNSDTSAGQFNLLAEAKAEIERMGPNPAILGREGASSSGRALLARQQSGLVEQAIYFGALEDWELRIYRQMWARARQYWQDPMWIRVTDDEGAPKFVQLNEPTPDPMTGALGYKNHVAEMDVDIIVDSTPDTANVQAEMFQDLMALVQANPMYAQQIPFEALLEISPVPHKKQFLDRIKGYREQAMQAQAAAQQQAAQVAGAKAQSEIDLNAAKARETEASGMKTAVETQALMNDEQRKAFIAEVAVGPAAGVTGDPAALG